LNKSSWNSELDPEVLVPLPEESRGNGLFFSLGWYSISVFVKAFSVCKIVSKCDKEGLLFLVHICVVSLLCA
jgi:hypothetical protein